MSVVELHPEDLLDRDVCGRLSPTESERLERHLDRCDACRLERQVRADFRDEYEPLPPEVDVPNLLAEVLDVGQSRRPRPRPMGPASRWRRSTLLVAAALLVAGVSAATWSQVSFVSKELPATVTQLVRAPAPTAAIANAPTAPRNEPAAAPPSTSSLSLGKPSGPALVPVAVAPQSSARRLARVDVPIALGTVAAPGRSSDSLAPSSASAAGELFARANEARRAGDRSHAAELYRALAQRFPGSPEAQESRAVLGRMLLEDGEANAALHTFDDYLHTGGVLREDVMVDRAAALAHLGRSGEEANAWASLLRTYPSSVHAERARERLRHLGDFCERSGECERTQPR
jgi:TolA-binding protein